MPDGHGAQQTTPKGRKQERMKKYEVNANGNRTFSAARKTSVMRVAKKWKQLGFAPRMYCVDGDPVTVTEIAIAGRHRRLGMA